MQEVKRENPPTDQIDLPESDVIRVEAAPQAAPYGRPAREEYRRLYRLVAVTDAGSVVAAFAIAHVLRFLRLGFGTDHDFLRSLILGPLFALAFFVAFRLYEVHHFTPAEEFRRIILAVSVAIMAFATLAFWSRTPLSRLWIGLTWGFAVLFTLMTRRLWHWHLGRARKRGRYSFRTLIVGTNGEAVHLEQLMRHPTFGFLPVGFISIQENEGTPVGSQVVGNIAQLRERIRDSGAECLFVASSEVGVEEMGRIAKAGRLENVDVRVTATLPEVLSSRLSVQPVGGLMVLTLRPVRLTGPQAVFKRAFDLIVAGLGVVVTLPMWGAIALAIKVTSPGPVLYKQVRVGQRGRPFKILKFRTMVADAESMLDSLRAQNEADGPLFKLRRDPRVTRVGRWLRRWSLDEFPQLVNVIRGDMSLVGPRPPLSEEVRAYEDWQFDRLEVRPGITGLWQVSGRSDLSFDEYVRLDLFYVENWSLAYDLFILAKTPRVLLSRRGAY